MFVKADGWMVIGVEEDVGRLGEEAIWTEIGAIYIYIRYRV